MHVVQSGIAYNLTSAPADPWKGGSPAVSADSVGYSDASSFSMQPHQPEAQAGAGHAQWDEAAWMWDSLTMEALPAFLSPDKEVSLVTAEAAPAEDPKVVGRKVKVNRKQKTQSGVRTVVGAGSKDGSKDGGGPLICQADSCGADLTGMRAYNRRYKVCYTCLKLSLVRVRGMEVRFCQQCSCFHEIASFDGKKRSCREQLDRHNKRRRERMEAAAKKVMAADPTGDRSLSDFLPGDAKKRACRPIMPMDSVSSETLFTPSTSFTPNTSFSMTGPSGSGGSFMVPPLPRPHVPMDDTAFIQAVDKHAAMLAAEQGSVSLSANVTDSGQPEDFHKLVQGMDLEKLLGESPAGAKPPPPLFSSSRLTAGPTGAPPPVTSGLNFGVPSSGDISTLRQLVTSESIFVMPKASNPVVTGPALSNSLEPTADHLRVEISAASTASVTSGVPMRAPAPAPAPAPALDQQLSQPVLKNLSSFDKWAAMALLDEPSPQPELRHVTSVDKFWNSLEAGVDLAALQQQPHPQGTTSVAAVADSLATTSIGGPQISLSEQIIQDALGMLDNPLATVYPEPKDELVRLSFKMFDRDPSHLAQDTRQRLSQSAPGGLAQDGYLQQGCTHMVVDLLVPNDHALSYPTVLSRGLSDGTLAGVPEHGTHFFSGSGVVQGPAGAAVRVEGGRVVATSSGGGKLMPRVLGSETPVLCGGSGEHLVTVYVIHCLSTGPAHCLQVAVRHAGAYVDASLLSTVVLGEAPALSDDAVLVRMQLSIPADSLGEGLVLVEVVNRGVLSAALPLVATSDAGIARELLQLGPARPLAPIANGGRSDTTARLVSDIGMVLDWGASAGTARDKAALLSTEALEAHTASLAGRARSALLVAAERGWASVSVAVLEATQADGATPAEVYEAIDGMRAYRGAGLLHAAIRGGNLLLMALLLEWASDAGVILPVAEARHGGSASPLHLAALVEDGGAMAELLLQHAAPGNSARQYELWVSPGTGGASPEAVATKCRRRSTVQRMELKRHRADEEAEAVMCDDIETLRVVAPREVDVARPGETWVEADQSQLAKARKLWAAEQRKTQRPVISLGNDDGAIDRMDSAKGYSYTPGGAQSPTTVPQTRSAPVAVATTALPEVPEDDELGEYSPSNDLGKFSDRYVAIPRTDSARDEQEDSSPVQDTPQGDGKVRRAARGYAGRRTPDGEKAQMRAEGSGPADEWASQVGTSSI